MDIKAKENQPLTPRGTVIPQRKTRGQKTLDQAIADYQKAALAVNLFKSAEWEFLMSTLYKLINECTREIISMAGRPGKNQEYMIQLTASRNAYLSVIDMIAISPEALKKAEDDIEAAESMNPNQEIIGSTEPTVTQRLTQ